MSNALSLKFGLVDRYISLAACGSRSQWKNLSDDCVSALKACKFEKEAIYKNGPKVHGAFQGSQLDILDKAETSIGQIMMNAERAAISALR